MESLKTHEYTHEGNARRIRILVDEDPINPREGGGSTYLVLAHRRYRLPSETPLPGWDPHDPASSPRVDVVLLPVWGYDHGSLSMKAGARVWPFDDPWDSGLLGYIWAKRGTYGKSDDELRSILEEEVSAYSRYLNGEAYGWIIEELATFSNATFGDPEEWVTLDSCYGYYSTKEALDAAMEQANIPQGGSL